MSYIRASSNPEGLYIFGGIKGIEISTGRNWELTNVGPYDGRSMVVPYVAFVEACRQWQEGLEDTIEVDGFCLTNQLVHLLDGKQVDYSVKDFLADLSSESGRPSGDKNDKGSIKDRYSFAGVRLTYGDRHCTLYHATWGYVVANSLIRI